MRKALKNHGLTHGHLRRSFSNISGFHTFRLFGAFIFPGEFRQPQRNKGMLVSMLPKPLQAYTLRLLRNSVAINVCITERHTAEIRNLKQNIFHINVKAMLIQPSRVILQNFRSQRHAVQRKRNAARELRKLHVPPFREKSVVFNWRHFSRCIVYLTVI